MRVLVHSMISRWTTGNKSQSYGHITLDEMVIQEEPSNQALALPSFDVRLEHIPLLKLLPEWNVNSSRVTLQHRKLLKN